MSKREKILTNEYVHLYSRGINKNNIFLDNQDYFRFLNLVKYCNKRNSAPFSELLRKKPEEISNVLKNPIEELGEILICTLMPNHFHILVKCLEDGSISKLMQRTLGSYAMYFNVKYSKSGHKFESKYKFRKITDEHDLSNTIDYIYNNPLKILDKNYKHIDLLNGLYKTNKRQRLFLKNYKFTYKGPTFVKRRSELCKNKW